MDKKWTYRKKGNKETEYRPRIAIRPNVRLAGTAHGKRGTPRIPSFSSSFSPQLYSRSHESVDRGCGDGGFQFDHNPTGNDRIRVLGPLQLRLSKKLLYHFFNRTLLGKSNRKSIEPILKWFYIFFAISKPFLMKLFVR